MLSGELVQWNDERGFGFIAGSDGKRYFVHISNIGRIANRPLMGDSVQFVPGIGRDGAPAARNVTIRGANPRASRQVLQRGIPERKKVLDWRLPLALLLVGLILAASLLGNLPREMILIYIAMAAISLALYRFDKKAAENHQWRMSEATLLGADLGFGIIGGLFAQALFWHKTRKPGYVATTLLIAGVHLLWLGGLAAGLVRLEDLQDLAAALLSFGG